VESESVGKKRDATICEKKIDKSKDIISKIIEEKIESYNSEVENMNICNPVESKS